MLDGDKKIFMTITLNFYIVVNKSYSYNYSEKFTIWLIISYKIIKNYGKENIILSNIQY